MHLFDLQKMGLANTIPRDEETLNGRIPKNNFPIIVRFEVIVL